MEAFVYCWTDKDTNKLYVGSHKGSADDGYVCSSKYMLAEYAQRPQDFSRQIVARGSHSDMRKFEAVILQSVNAKINEGFYNRHNNDGLYFDGWQKGQMSTEHRKKLSESAKKRKLSPEHKEKLHQGRRNTKNSAEHTAAILTSKKSFVYTPESRKKMSDSRKALVNAEVLSSKAGSASQKKRLESGYYQTEEWKEKCKAGWETRRANAVKKTTGGIG